VAIHRKLEGWPGGAGPADAELGAGQGGKVRGSALATRLATPPAVVAGEAREERRSLEVEKKR
jgi:hypothetical protein